MSYAAVTKEHREPLADQPHPDLGLLNTAQPPAGEQQLPDGDSSKVTIAPADWKEKQEYDTTTIKSDLAEAMDATTNAVPAVNNDNKNGSQKRKERKERAKDTIDEYEQEGLQLWEKTKQVVLQPGVAGGILGVVNLGLIGTVSYKLYTTPSLRTDQRFLTTSSLSLLSLLGLEGWYANAYAQTEAGQREAEKAKEEGAAIYKQAKTVVLRPGVLGGIVGVVNVGILGGVGYWSYANWDRPSAWDRRTVSTATVGLLALFAGEGYLGEEYKEKEYPKHK